MVARVASIALLLLVVSGAVQAQNVIYVDQNASLTPHDGSSWCNAFLTLDEALDASTGGFTIKVADGTYIPDTAGLADPCMATFTMVSGVSVQGGYAGCGAPDPNVRDFDLYETTLSGSIGDPVDLWDNCYHVVTSLNCDSQTVLDGFRINDGRGGIGNYDFPHTAGADLYILGGELQIKQCVIRSEGRGFPLVSVEADISIDQCLFEYNRFSVAYHADSSVSYSNSVFRNNGGVAISSYRTDLTINHCDFHANIPFGGGEGGAIRHWGEGGSAYINDSTFTNNGEGSLAGGAIYLGGGLPKEIRNCTFTDNVTNGDGGGAIVAADAVISNCRFERNRATWGSGGAVWSPADITGCEFIGNSAGEGGAVSIPGFGLGGARVDHCTFINNSSDSWGGAVECISKPIEINHCIFSGNSAKWGGAFSRHSCADGPIRNCVFIDNSASESGGAVYVWEDSASTMEVINCSFHGNDAPEGGAIALTGDSNTVHLEMNNSILWGNTANTDPQIFVVPWGTAVVVNNSCIEGGYAGTNNISTDPQFADADLRLSETSPCIEAGNNDAVPATLTTDLDGNPRIAGCFVDMGAYEFPGGRPLMGDIDGDCDLDLVDYEYFDVCLSLSGPGAGSIFQECIDTFDFDSDGDIDLADFAVYQQLAG